MDNENRVLGWDDEISQESNFTLLPEGEYDFEVVGFDQGMYNGSNKLPACPKAELTLRVDGGDQGTTQVFENLFLVSSMEWKISEFFLSIGQKKKGESFVPKWDQVLGSTGRANIEVNTYVDRNGEERQNNRVKNFLPKEAQTEFTPGKF